MIQHSPSTCIQCRKCVLPKLMKSGGICSTQYYSCHRNSSNLSFSNNYTKLMHIKSCDSLRLFTQYHETYIMCRSVISILIYRSSFFSYNKCHYLLSRQVARPADSAFHIGAQHIINNNYYTRVAKKQKDNY